MAIMLRDEVAALRLSSFRKALGMFREDWLQPPQCFSNLLLSECSIEANVDVQRCSLEVMGTMPNAMR